MDCLFDALQNKEPVELFVCNLVTQYWSTIPTLGHLRGIPHTKVNVVLECNHDSFGDNSVFSFERYLIGLQVMYIGFTESRKARGREWKETSWMVVEAWNPTCLCITMEPHTSPWIISLTLPDRTLILDPT